jgi:hypothetical protein
MSGPLQPRRTARQPEPRRTFADEQAWQRQQQEEAREIQRLLATADLTAEPSDSSESDLADQEGSSSEDDEKARQTDENTPQWTRQLHDVHFPVCSATPVVTLPRHRVRTELGFLQCFIDPALIDHFVTNTNLYAAARRVTAWVDTDAQEMWRFLAVRIRQGIVVLPELHMYWADGYRDQYVSQLMTRDRFMCLLRCFHIEPPVDRDVRQTVIVKTAKFYHQCQALFKEYFMPGRDFALDETMIRYQGCSSWITVIKGKPTPVGYKLYTVASEATCWHSACTTARAATRPEYPYCTTRSLNWFNRGEECTDGCISTTSTLLRPCVIICCRWASIPAAPVVQTVVDCPPTSRRSARDFRRTRSARDNVASWAV